MHIRDERPGDVQAIHTLTQAAFTNAPHAGGNEAQIVDTLRHTGALTLSLLAEEEGLIVGHVAFSPVTIPDVEGWFGLGPISVLPDRQRQGIGSALIGEGLSRLRQCGASGCLLLGDPAYYSRFGFTSDPRLTYLGYQTPNLQRLVLNGQPPVGAVVYHAAFDSS